MCGLFNLHDNPGVRALMLSLGMPEDSLNLNFAKQRPGNAISIISAHQGQAGLYRAIWHLYLIAKEGRWVLHPKYWSINTRSDKLKQKKEFSTSRCLIPATAFIESKQSKNPHLLEFDQAFFFGGLKKHWVDQQTGEELLSCSIITLPPHAKLATIHPQSIPMILDPRDTLLIERWLDPEFKDTEAFSGHLNPRIPWDLRATPVDTALKQNPIAPSFMIIKD